MREESCLFLPVGAAVTVAAAFPKSTLWESLVYVRSHTLTGVFPR